MENVPSRIIWHHTGDSSNSPQFDKVNAYHKSRGFPKSEIGLFGGYHILIEKDGEVRRYRLDTEIGAHTFNHNQNTLGICLAGNFSREYPTKQQEKSAEKVIREWQRTYDIEATQIFPHRKFNATECPGKNLPDDYILQLLAQPEFGIDTERVRFHLTEALKLLEPQH